MEEMNRVTWCSKLLSAAVLLLALPLAMFYLGAEVERLAKPDELPQPVVVAEKIEPEPVTTNRTYVDSTYGWSFEYPSDWLVSSDGKKIIVSSPELTSGIRGATSVASYGFSSVRKDQFEPANTKLGDIRFDLTRDALVDVSVEPQRCLSAAGRIGAENEVPVIGYGGSMMSDPAWGASAVITDGDYLVLWSETTYEYIEPESATGRGEALIRSSFHLPTGTSAVVPACAR